MAKTMKNISRGMAVLTVPFTMSFPKVLGLFYCFSHDLLCMHIFPVLFKICVNKGFHCQGNGFKHNGTSSSLKPGWRMSYRLQF